MLLLHERKIALREATSIGNSQELVLGCDFLFHDEGVLRGGAIVRGAFANGVEAVLPVKGNGGVVGLADFQEDPVRGFRFGLRKQFTEQFMGKADAALRGIDGEVEDFGLPTDKAGHEESGDGIANFHEQNELSRRSGIVVALRRPPGRFRGAPANREDGCGITRTILP